MKKPVKDKELIDLLEQDKLNTLLDKLDSYTVPHPAEEEIEATINRLSLYMPSRQKRSHSRFTFLFHRAVQEVSFIHPFYWIASAILFIAGYLITLQFPENLPVTLIVLAPVPFILGLLELFKGREQGVLELELTCRISAREIFLSRLLVISIYGTFLNTALSAAAGWLNPGIPYWQILISWMAPFTMAAAVTLWVATKIRGGYTATAMLAVWMSGMLALLSQPTIRYKIMHLNIMTYTTIILLSLVMISAQAVRIMRHYEACYERGDLHAVNN